jgi:Ribosomal protein L5
MQRLKKIYLEKIVPRFKEHFNYVNIHQVPKVKKLLLIVEWVKCIKIQKS